MNETYIYHKPPRHTRWGAYRRNFKLIVGILIAVGVIAIFIYANLRSGQKNSPQTSAISSTTIADPTETFLSADFQFSDTGKWVLDQKDSTANEYLYTDYLGQVLEAQLDVYINQVPSRAYVTRVLPVRIVNNDSFEITGVSDPCVNQYAAGEPHRVKEVSIKDAAMLCDPDDPQYSVILSEIGGDYQLHLRRPDGTAIQVIIIYRNQDINPRPNNLLNIASSFKTR